MNINLIKISDRVGNHKFCIFQFYLFLFHFFLLINFIYRFFGFSYVGNYKGLYF